MSWSDPARRFEPAEDVELRSELKDLLGLAEMEAPASVSTPELMELAESLRREAERRRHATLRPRPSWRLATAAALPILLGLGAVGTWGYQQKHRADTLASQVADKDAQIQRIASEGEAARLELASERAAKEDAQQKLVQVAQKLSPQDRQPYLVIPAKKPVGAEVMDTLRVKAPGR
jgi:outer membrane murein-binding lipoprotein Lpp